MTTELPQIFVLHVREGYEDRATHIDSMMARLGLPFEYILDGDKADLTPEILEHWFAGPMKCVQGATSCAFKHLIACQKIVSQALPGALVLEDDIVLSPRHEEVTKHTVAELPAAEPAIISYEETRLRYVPRSRRRKGQYLYTGDRDRFAGAIYINAAGARVILEEAEKNGLDCPIDIFHRRLLGQGCLKYYWSHPCTAVQGSFNGLFRTGFDARRSTNSSAKAMIWKAKRLYRKLLYFFR